MSQDAAMIEAIMSPTEVSQTTEVTTEPTSQPVVKEIVETPEPDLSASMAQILKREAQLNKKRAELREAEETASKWRGYKDRASKGDYAAALEALGELGLDYDKLTAFLLDDAQQDPAKQEFRKLQDEIAAIREDAKRQAAEAKAAEEAEAIEVFKEALVDTANQLGESLEFVQAAGQEAIDLAFEVLQLYWEQNGSILPREEALQMVERHLEQQHVESVSKLKNMKKLSNYFAKEPSPASEQARNLPPQQSMTRGQPPAARTLAGQNGAFSANSAAPQSEEELRAAAIAALMR